jgi:hypothetical protein
MEAVLRRTRSAIAPWRFTFLIKLLALAALVALADRLFYRADDVGATLGVFVLALLVSLIALRPEVRRAGRRWRRRARRTGSASGSSTIPARSASCSPGFRSVWSCCCPAPTASAADFAGCSASFCTASQCHSVR